MKFLLLLSVIFAFVLAPPGNGWSSFNWGGWNGGGGGGRHGGGCKDSCRKWIEENITFDPDTSLNCDSLVDTDPVIEADCVEIARTACNLCVDQCSDKTQICALDKNDATGESAHCECKKGYVENTSDEESDGDGEESGGDGEESGGDGEESGDTDDALNDGEDANTGDTDDANSDAVVGTGDVGLLSVVVPAAVVDAETFACRNPCLCACHRTQICKMKKRKGRRGEDSTPEIECKCGKGQVESPAGSGICIDDTSCYTDCDSCEIVCDPEDTSCTVCAAETHMCVTKIEKSWWSYTVEIECEERPVDKPTCTDCDWDQKCVDGCDKKKRRLLQESGDDTDDDTGKCVLKNCSDNGGVCLATGADEICQTPESGL